MGPSGERRKELAVLGVAVGRVRARAAVAALLAVLGLPAGASAGWDPPRELSTSSSAPLNLAATAGIDAQGRAIVLWHAQPGVESVVRAVGHGFGRPRAIPGSELSMPDLQARLAFDPRGAAIAVWSYFEPRPRFVEDGYAVDYRFGLRVAGRAAGHAFGRAQTLTDQLDSDPSADAAFDPSGNAVVVWTDDAGMHASARPAGRRRFGRAQVVGDTKADPQVATGARGSAVAAWAAPGSARVSVSNRGTHFGESRKLAIKGLGKAKPVLAVDGRSGVTAAWARDGRVMAATCSASGRCGRPQALSPAGEKAADPAVAVSADGTALVAWRTAGAVSASARRGHGAFKPAAVLGKLEKGERATDVAVAVGRKGAAALWMVDSDHGARAHAAIRRGVTHNFGRPRAISSAIDGVSLSDPEVVVGRDGGALAVWGALVDGRPSIHAAAYKR